MIQVLSTYRSGSVSPGDTDPHQFDNVGARLVVLHAPAANSGTVTILGVDGADTLDTAGVVLAAGETLRVWTSNLNRLGYQMSNGADSLGYLVGR